MADCGIFCPNLIISSVYVVKAWKVGGTWMLLLLLLLLSVVFSERHQNFCMGLNSTTESVCYHLKHSDSRDLWLVLCDTWNWNHDNNTVSVIAILDTNAIPELHMKLRLHLQNFAARYGVRVRRAISKIWRHRSRNARLRAQVSTKLEMRRFDTSAAQILQFAKNLLYCDFISALQCAVVANSRAVWAVHGIVISRYIRYFYQIACIWFPITVP